MSSVFADRDVFESLAPPPVATTELKGERHANACRALEQGVRTYLRKQARIERKRCFLVPGDTDWISMEKFVGNELAHQGGKRLSFDWHDPGIDLVAVWSLGRFAMASWGATRIAVAMGTQLVDGQSIVGYYELK